MAARIGWLYPNLSLSVDGRRMAFFWQGRPEDTGIRSSTCPIQSRVGLSLHRAAWWYRTGTPSITLAGWAWAAWAGR